MLAPQFDVFDVDESVAGWLVVGLSLAVPGLKSSEEFKLEWLEDTNLFIRGRLATTLIPTFGLNESKILKTVHKERHAGPFERSITLPAEADTRGLTLEVKDGLVFVRIPKKLPEEIETERKKP